MGQGASQGGYQGGEGVIDWLPGADGELFVKVYNDRAATVTNGDVYFLSYLKDIDSLTVAGRPTLDPIANTAVWRQVVVVNNAPLKATGIADTEWGYVQVRGYCPQVKVDSAVDSVDHYIQGVTGQTYAIAETTPTTITNDTFGIAVSAYVAATGFCTAVLFGDRSLVTAE